MADDLAAMLRQTNTGPVDIIGQSDGAILGLLLAIHHPALVSKLVAFAPNLRPDNTALVGLVPAVHDRTRLAEGPFKNVMGPVDRFAGVA
jgi:pimeloyl-ACP methyl ester carboxylesterase